MPRRRTAPAPTAHPLGLVARRTGLSADVLRAWERRYGVVSPMRDAGGRRVYSDADLKRLTLLSQLARAGRAVSTLVALSERELERLATTEIAEQAVPRAASARHRERALAAVRALDPESYAGALRRALLSLGTPQFLDEVLSPVLTEIGEEWHERRLTVAHEHAATAAAEQLLGSLLREFTPAADAPRVLLATPRGERHSLGALMAAALAAHDEWRVTWLGADLSAAQVAAAAASQETTVVGLSVVSRAGAARGLRAEISALRGALDPRIALLVGGAGAGIAMGIDGVDRASSLGDWRHRLARLAPAPRD